MKSPSAVLLAVAALSAGFILGRVGPGAPGASASVPVAEVERLERERDEALVRAKRAEGALEGERRRRAELDAAALTAESGASATGPSAETPAPANGGGLASPEADTPEARAAAVKALVASIAPALEGEDGERALEILRRLAAIVPEGRDAAMELAVRLNDDVSGAATLRLDQVGFHTTLGDTPLRDLMIWSLDHPAPARFRVLSALSLPWVVPKDRALDILSRSLDAETDAQTQQALVVSLSQMNDSRAQKLLASVLADPSRTAELRAQIAGAAAGSSNPDMEKALEGAAAGDASEAVRAAARSALAARNPSQDGFLVTAVYPDGAAMAGGMRAGDILLWYDGRAIRDPGDVRGALEAPSTAETAAVVVLRDGQETGLTVRRGRLGIQGRAVKRK